MRGMKCELCPKGKREKLEDDGSDIDPRGKNHIHIMQVNKKGKIVWANCYLDKLVPFSKFDDFLGDFIEAVDKSAKKLMK